MNKKKILICVGIILLLLVITTSLVLKKNTIVQNTSPSPQSKTDEKLIFAQKYTELAKQLEEQNYTHIYTDFAPQDQKDEVTEKSFVSTLTDFKKITQTSKLTFQIHDVVINQEAQTATVDRTITFCTDANCTEKKSQRSKVVWMKEGDSWRAKNEFPFCLEEPSESEQTGLEAAHATEREVIVTTQLSCNMFPLYWSISPQQKYASFRDMATPLDEEYAGRSIEAVRTGLRKYPVAVLRNQLKHVYLSGSLNFYGVIFGSTYSTQNVYLTGGPIMQGYTDEYIEGKLHHEFSSILRKNYKDFFQTDEWLAVNPSFHYGNGGVGAISKGKASEQLSPQLAKMGILNQYGASGLEEDFNEYAQVLFLGDKQFWQFVEHYPRVQKKAKLIIAFYQKIDNSLDENYFRSLAK